MNGFGESVRLSHSISRARLVPLSHGIILTPKWFPQVCNSFFWIYRFMNISVEVILFFLHCFNCFCFFLFSLQQFPISSWFKAHISSFTHTLFSFSSLCSSFESEWCSLEEKSHACEHTVFSKLKVESKYYLEGKYREPLEIRS